MKIEKLNEDTRTVTLDDGTKFRYAIQFQQLGADNSVWEVNRITNKRLRSALINFRGDVFMAGAQEGYRPDY